jgi:hypothetical protein
MITRRRLYQERPHLTLAELTLLPLIEFVRTACGWDCAKLGYD